MAAVLDQLMRWGHGALTLELDLTSTRVPTIRSLSLGDHEAVEAAEPSVPRQPLAEVLIAGEGRRWSGGRTVGTAIGERLRLDRLDESRDGRWRTLDLRLDDPATGLEVGVSLRTVDGVPALQATTSITNLGSSEVVLHGLTSFAADFAPMHSIDDLELLWARSDWLAENRWVTEGLRTTLPDIDAPTHGHRWRGCVARVGRGAWSTNTELPMGALLDRRTGRSWAWQIEHNGPWRWEVGESPAGAYVAAMGPTDRDHQWQHRLLPGDSFVSVPVGLVVSDSGLDGLAAGLAAYRREVVRDHPDRKRLSVVFNDYMNTLMGDPTSEALEPLVDAAASVGAEVFCIDAGWYDNLRTGDWAHELGSWTPSTNRFPDGLARVAERIRAAGMTPGLWLEPEVMGVANPLASELPPEAYFQRSGRRQVEDGRYLLDFRHPATIGHLDAVVDRLVGDLGVGYFKFDYNVDAAPGTDVEAESAGDGLLGHDRAFLAWLERLLDRHPSLVIENCASGGMRADYALLARTQLQSTSDQQDPLRYPPIAVGALLSMLPEQAANWAYPQPTMSDAEIAFTLVTGMAGRLYLSGHLDQMSGPQRALVEEAVRAYKAIRPEIGRSVPCWPTGLPDWTDPWVSVGFRPDAGRPADPTYVALWRRPGGPSTIELSLQHLAGSGAVVEIVFPAGHDAWATEWFDVDGRLIVQAQGQAPEARLLRLVPSLVTSRTA